MIRGGCHIIDDQYVRAGRHHAPQLACDIVEPPITGDMLKHCDQEYEVHVIGRKGHFRRIPDLREPDILRSAFLRHEITDKIDSEHASASRCHMPDETAPPAPKVETMVEKL
jgi:hypothetical protein